MYCNCKCGTSHEKNPVLISKLYYQCSRSLLYIQKISPFLVGINPSTDPSLPGDDHIWKIFSDMSTISVNCADVNRKWDDKQHGDSGVLAGLWYQKSGRFHTLCKEEIAVFLVPKIIARKATNSHSTDDNCQVRNACEDRYLVISWNCQGTGKCYEDGNVTLITSNSVSLKVEIFWMNSTCVWNEELCGS